jgi:DNA-binding transcriptional LysR family regulator
MIAVRIGPDMRWAVVGTPGYFEGRPVPKHPKDLTEHNCINLRLPTYGGLYVWEFEKDGREVKVRVEGQLTFNATAQRLDAALAGLGLAFIPEDLAQLHIGTGRLKRVLHDWCPVYPGYHLYYPSRRQPSALARVCFTGRSAALSPRQEHRRARVVVSIAGPPTHACAARRLLAHGDSMMPRN